MDLGQIYQKTEKGQEEIRSRRYKLAKRPRVLLILVDGRTPLDIVLGQARALGIEDSTVFQLITDGFIAPLATSSADFDDDANGSDPDSRFRIAQRIMNESIVNALGLRALFFTLKLERCATLDDLRALIDSYHQALARTGDQAQAEVLTAKVRRIIG